MPSPIDVHRQERPLTAEVFALALVAASSLQIMENLVPRFPLFPWMRLGLSYVVILPFLLRYGSRAACALLLARNLIAILYGGQPFSTFLISSGSGCLTFLGLGPLVDLGYRRGYLGLCGAGVALASAFNVAQLVLVKWTLIRHAGFYFQIGPILAWSLLSGLGVAALVRLSEADFARLLGGAQPAAGADAATPAPTAWAPASGGKAFLWGLAALAALLVIPSLPLQAASLLALAASSRDRGKILLASWPFFFYVAWLHLFHTPGVFVFKDWITREGLLAFGLHAARLANLILLGRWLSRRFPWHWGRHSRSTYVRGFIMSLPALPDLFAPSLKLGRELARGLATGKGEGALAPAFEAWRARMVTSTLPQAEAEGRRAA